MSFKQTKKSFSLLLEKYAQEKLTASGTDLEATQKRIVSYLKSEPTVSSLLTDETFDDKGLMLKMLTNSKYLIAQTSSRLKVDSDIVSTYCQDFIDKKVISLFRLTNHLNKVKSEASINTHDVNHLETELKAKIKLMSSNSLKDSITSLDNAVGLETYSLGYPHTNEDKTDLTKASYLEFVLPLLRS